MRPKMLAFDFDGTLVDTEEAVVETFNRALVQCGCPQVRRDWLAGVIGMPLAEMFAKALPPTSKVSPRDLVRVYRELFDTYGTPLISPREGAHELLLYLERQGVRRCIVSNRGKTSLRALVKHLGWHERFETVLSAEEVAAAKPSPEIVRRAIELSGLEPSEIWMVGDSIWDIQAAQEAGVKSVAIEGGAHSPKRLSAAKPTLQFEQLLGLLEWLTSSERRGSL